MGQVWHNATRPSNSHCSVVYIVFQQSLLLWSIVGSIKWCCNYHDHSGHLFHINQSKSLMHTHKQTDTLPENRHLNTTSTALINILHRYSELLVIIYCLNNICIVLHLIYITSPCLLALHTAPAYTSYRPPFWSAPLPERQSILPPAATIKPTQ